MIRRRKDKTHLVAQGKLHSNYASRHYYHLYLWEDSSALAGNVNDKSVDHHTLGCHVQEHLLIAEKALGKPLPPAAIVHHANGVKDDNRQENLVICEDQAYHKLLHQRMRAYKISGDPSQRPCVFCHKHDQTKNMKRRANGSYHHKKCVNKYNADNKKQRYSEKQGLQ